MILSFEHFEHIAPNKLNILGENLLNHSKPGTIFFGSAPAYGRESTPAGLVHPNCKSKSEWDIWFYNLGFDILDFSILENRAQYGIPPTYYDSSYTNELFYIKK